MANLLDDFIEGLYDYVDETPAAEDINAPSLRIEDYEVDLSPKEKTNEPNEKQKGKKSRGLDDIYESVTEGGEVLIKRPRIEGCLNAVLWLEKKVENPSINSLAIHDHLSECLRLKKDMAKWDGMDETKLQSQMFLSLFKVFH